MKNIERFTWAIEVLDMKPSDKILECGCGTGIAAGMIASRLKSGHLVAIDRSETMIDKARKNNVNYLQEKKISFRTVELAKFQTRDQVFNRIFSFNVNLFWTQKEIAAEAKVLRSHLVSGGRLYLFYQPPSELILDKITNLVSHNLEREHWRIEKILYNKKISSSCFIAVPLKIK
jgi:protein-L-isoaspartate O-methyltransferase